MAKNKKNPGPRKKIAGSVEFSPETPEEKARRADLESGVNDNNNDDDNDNPGNEEFALFFEDEDDAESEARERAEMVDMARLVVTGREKIETLLDQVEGTDALGVMVASFLREDLEKRIPEDLLDRMLTVNFLLRARNAEELLPGFDDKTRELAAEFDRISPEDTREERLHAVMSFSPEARNLFLVNIIGGLELFSNLVRGDDSAAPDDGLLREQTDFIIGAARMPGIDDNLRERAVDSFNALSRLSRSAIVLKSDDDGNISVHLRKASPKKGFTPPGP